MSALSLVALATSAAALLAILVLRQRRRGRRALSGLISEQQWRQFDSEGFVVLPASQVFESAEELGLLQRRLNEIMLGVADVPYEKMMMQLDSTTGSYADAGEQTLGFKGATLRYRKIQNLEHDPDIMEYLRKPIFREACARVYSPETPIASFRTMFFSKPCRLDDDTPGGTRLPWHQDRWKLLDRDPLLNVYLALDEATRESGCVQIIPRSHHRGVINPSHHSAFLTDEQIAAHASDSTQMLDLVLRPGETCLMHNWVVHCSGTNATAAPRRALSVSFMDARSHLASAPLHSYTGGELKSTGYPEGVADGGATFPLIFSPRAG